jgi:hypothetical protein
MEIITRRADEIIPGDIIASDVLGMALGTVTRVRLVEHTTTKDEVWIETDSTAICPDLVRRVDSNVRIMI